jgi:hypothetical protein
MAESGHGLVDLECWGQGDIGNSPTKVLWQAARFFFFKRIIRASRHFMDSLRSTHHGIAGTNITSALLGTLVNQHLLVFLYRKLSTNVADTLLRPSNLFRLIFLELYRLHVLLQQLPTTGYQGRGYHHRYKYPLYHQLERAYPLPLSPTVSTRR